MNCVTQKPLYIADLKVAVLLHLKKNKHQRLLFLHCNDISIAMYSITNFK